MKQSDISPRRLRDKLSERARRTSHRGAIGASPIQIAAPSNASETRVRFMKYDQDLVTEHEDEDATFWEGDDSIRWIDISGLKHQDRITGICQRLNLHPLTVADIFHTDQRPKTEVSSGYVQITLRMPIEGPPFEADQLTVILGRNYVLSVRENQSESFAPVRSRLQGGGSHIRSSPGYLAYALVDLAIDSYFPILERYGDITESLEEHILTDPRDGVIREIHLLKRELLDLRHALWPLREAVNALVRDDVPNVEDKLKPYLRDCADHAFQLLDMVEVYREVAQGLVDLHLSSLSNRMNEVMKVLTIIATIFIPMTFIAGVYGMNFDRASPYNLPELSWRFGYIFAIGLMAASSTTMLFMFWRMGWIFGGKKATRRKTLSSLHQNNPDAEQRKRPDR